MLDRNYVDKKNHNSEQKMPGKPAAHLRKRFFLHKIWRAAGEGRLAANLAGTLQLTDLMQTKKLIYSSQCSKFCSKT